MIRILYRMVCPKVVLYDCVVDSSLDFVLFISMYIVQYVVIMKTVSKKLQIYMMKLVEKSFIMNQTAQLYMKQVTMRFLAVIQNVLSLILLGWYSFDTSFLIISI